MENINGDASAPVRLESADAGSEDPDLIGVSWSDPLEFAETCIERAQDSLCYGRRQEAEQALLLLKQARFAIQAARSTD